MLLENLGFYDFIIIGCLIVVVLGGRAATSAYIRPGDRERFKRIEQKLDLILEHLGLEYRPPKAEWQELADDPAKKIAAIKAYRAAYGEGLAESKAAVEEYIAGRSA